MPVVKYALIKHAHLFELLRLVDGVPEPEAVEGEALIYVDEADGDLKVKFGDGVVKTLASDEE